MEKNSTLDKKDITLTELELQGIWLLKVLAVSIVVLYFPSDIQTSTCLKTAMSQERHESNFHLSEIVLILGKSSDLLPVNNKPLSCEVISNTPCHLKRCIQLTWTIRTWENIIKEFLYLTGSRNCSLWDITTRFY
jgi:hypothetical protein